jgi:uncharacterized protein (TIGR03067 family)
VNVPGRRPEVEARAHHVLDMGGLAMRKSLLALLLIGLASGADSPKEWDDTTTMALNLEGSWRLVGLMRSGVEAPNPGNWDLDFHGDKYSWVMGGTPVVTGTYKLSVARMPAQLDLMPNATTTNRGICRVDGDVLTIALFEPENVRPRSFGDANLKVLTLRRVKK